jgi:hypothetical protein
MRIIKQLIRFAKNNNTATHLSSLESTKASISFLKIQACIKSIRTFDYETSIEQQNVCNDMILLFRSKYATRHDYIKTLQKELSIKNRETELLKVNI